MKYHEVIFNLQRELEWISENVTILSAPMEIESLSFGKKHKKLEEEVNNHSLGQGCSEWQGVIVWSQGCTEVVTNTANPTDAWNNLFTAIETKVT